MNQPKIIGVVGASGSGKTTIAQELAALSGNCCMVSQDNYYLDLPLEVCLERRVARDVVERGRTEEMIRQRWAEQVEPMYRQHVEPTRAFADILLIPEERGTPKRERQVFQTLEKLN